MAEREADPEKPTSIDEDTEVLLGQMMFAIGQGADGVHIHRSAVAKMRERYRPTTYDFIKNNDCSDPRSVGRPNGRSTPSTRFATSK
jgi:hypothetical protein